MKKLPSARVLRRLIDYNPTTGEMFWRERPVWMFKPQPGCSAKNQAAMWNAYRANRRCFSAKHGQGYLEGGVLGKKHLAHRVIWTLAHGSWPNGKIDHINGIRTDNRLQNLRCVNDFQNAKNMALSKRNTSGVVGVTWCSEKKKWAAQICHNRKVIPLGRFEKIDDAMAARKAAERKYGFHPNHGRAA